MCMTASEKIFSILKERSMTQKEFSSLTGIAESTISDWKRKGNQPNLDKIQVICDVLKISPYELIWDGQIIKDEETFYMVDKESEEGMIISTLRSLDKSQVQRIIGYINAFKDI